MNVPGTILAQLGGNKFLAMTGAKDLVGDGNTLRMSLPRNMSKANRMYVTLNDKDLYDMRFFRRSGGNLSKKTWTFSPIREDNEKVYRDIYADQMCEIFEMHTGMRTRLF